MTKSRQNRAYHYRQFTHRREIKDSQHSSTHVNLTTYAGQHDVSKIRTTDTDHI